MWNAKTTMGCATLGAALASALAATPAHASFTQEPGSPFASGVNPYGVLIGDFNADTRPDLVAINGTSSTVSVLLRQPAGGFAQETGSPLGVGSGPNFGAVADFNADNRPDIAVANYVGGSVSVLLRQPGGGFANEAGSPFATGAATSVVAADFNGDNRPDLAVTNYSGSVTILLRKAGGGFAPEASAPAGSLARNIAAADFNGDGRPDLAVTNLGSANVTILLRKAAGGFEQEAGSPIAVGTSPAGIAAADLNGDGRPDLAVANFGSHTVSLLLRQPGGGFAPAAGSPIAAGLRPLGVAAADFNRDGLLDLVITNNNAAASAVTVLLRQPGGGFAQDPSSPVPTASGAYGIGIADFNADGRLDLAISNDGSSNVTILLNTTPEPVPPTAPVVVTQTQTHTPPPVVVATKPAPPVIAARLALSWSVTAKAVTINSAILSDVPVGATVRLVCGSCKLRQTLTAKKAGGLTLSALRGRKLRRGSSFSLTITKPGYVGTVLSRKVKGYGRSDAAIRKAARGPFSETRRRVP